MSLDGITDMDVHVIITYDYDMPFSDRESFSLRGCGCVCNIEWIKVEKTPYKYGYNLYCNALIDKVRESLNRSWYMFLDDDDTLIQGSINKLASHIERITTLTPIICQFKRGSKVKPSNDMILGGVIKSGQIGMPCIVLHTDLKHTVKFTHDGNADYLFINEIASLYPCSFLQLPIVYCDRRSFGLTIKNKINTWML